MHDNRYPKIFLPSKHQSEERAFFCSETDYLCRLFIINNSNAGGDTDLLLYAKETEPQVGDTFIFAENAMFVARVYKIIDIKIEQDNPYGSREIYLLTLEEV